MGKSIENTRKLFEDCCKIRCQLFALDDQPYDRGPNRFLPHPLHWIQ